jgi:hypothetical protein
MRVKTKPLMMVPESESNGFFTLRLLGFVGNDAEVVAHIYRGSFRPLARKGGRVWRRRTAGIRLLL